MKNKNHITVIILLMMVGAFARLIPHMPNFTPTEGLTILGAAYLGKKYLAVLLPAIMIFLSDLIINNTISRTYFTHQEGFVWFSPYMIFNFLSMIAVVLVCKNILKKVNFQTTMGSAVIASVIFFVLSNFGAWLGGELTYSKNFDGLMSSYAAGLPFFRTSLLSNLIFTGILFGSFEIFKSIETKKQTDIST